MTEKSNPLEVEITIAGAGVIGLAIAAAASERFSDIFIIEKNDRFGLETSSRNSEVIHAGIYYPENSLKARLCVEGRHLLYDRCRSGRIRHLKTGKLIVATRENESDALSLLTKKAEKNGVDDLVFLSKKEVTRLEPDVRAESAILSPSTGIIDSHGYMRSLYSQAKKNRSQFIFGTTVRSVQKTASGKYKVEVIYPDGEPFSFITRIFINCTGHFADTLAETMGIDIDAHNYRQHFWKGEYFSVETPSPFPVRHLVYPVPLPKNVGLGTHATLDLNGKLKLGPNAIYLEDRQIDYSVAPSHCDEFYEAAVRFLPFIKKESIKPEMAGVRPKLQKPGDPARDFIINEESDKGLPGIVNLIGMESPGLTASLAVSRYILKLIN